MVMKSPDSPFRTPAPPIPTDVPVIAYEPTNTLLVSLFDLVFEGRVNLYANDSL